MRTKHFFLLAIVLVLVSCIYIGIRGQSYTVTADLHGTAAEKGDYQVVIDQDGDILALTDERFNDGVLRLTLSSVGSGKAFIEVRSAEGPVWLNRFYVHRMGLITHDSVFGNCTGSLIIPVCVVLYLVLLLIHLIRRYRASVQENMYRYRNILLLGLIIFLAFLLGMLLLGFTGHSGLAAVIRRIFNSGAIFSLLALPVFFVLSVLVTISNIDLMRKEGRTWRNMLGCLFGLLLVLGSLFPRILGEYLQRTTLVDVHNEGGAALYIELFTENTIFFIVVYLECLLIATIIIAYKAAKHIPAFDKDYILILGCMIRKDGTLTPLLKGRADRAVEFARMQKQATGKEITFVPSGGQGHDEVIAEGDAIHNYLVSCGISEDRILTDNKSANTYENFGCSMALIRERSGGADPKIAFSTTNYHVFRSGMYAAKQGIFAEGIGSPTKRYFWINAFVREFIATLSAEKRTHLKIGLLLLVIILMAVLFLYADVNM